MLPESTQSDNGGLLSEALRELGAAEAHLKEARSNEVAAERDIAVALKEIEKQVEQENAFEIEIAYNGLAKRFRVDQRELVSALLQRAIKEFGIAQNPHLLSLYRKDGALVPEQGTIEQAHIKPEELLLLRQNVVKGGGGCA